MIKMRGININNEVHTGYDLDLLFTGFDNEMPAPKLLTEDIQGADGVTDYTEHAGLFPKYQNRNPVFHFFAKGTKAEIMEKFNVLARYHGQTVSVYIDDDNDFYFRGRATLASGEVGALYAYFDLAVSAFPYKLKKNLTVKKYALESGGNIIVENNIMPVKLSVKVLSVTDPEPSDSAVYGAQFTHNGKSSIIQVGGTKTPEFIIAGGAQKISVVGGKISNGNFLSNNSYGASFKISFREGKF